MFPKAREPADDESTALVDSNRVAMGKGAGRARRLATTAVFTSADPAPKGESLPPPAEVSAATWHYRGWKSQYQADKLDDVLGDVRR